MAKSEVLSLGRSVVPGLVCLYHQALVSGDWARAHELIGKIRSAVELAITGRAAA